MELVDIDESIDNDSEKRNCLYRSYVFCEHGYMGDLDRHPIPMCVQSYILSICPDEHTENDEDLLCKVRFNQGENVKVTISFDDTVPMSYVYYFVNQSPEQGWGVTLFGEYNISASIICTSVVAWRKLSIYLRLNDYEYTYIHWEIYENGELLGMENTM